MAETITNKDSMANSINDILNAADDKRSTELASSKLLEFIKQNAMVKEMARLTEKYGQDNERVQSMNVRISYSPSIQAVFDQEAIRLSIPAATVTDDGWIVEGFVTGADGKPMSGVTVFLSENGRSAWPGFPFSCTPATGAYSISLNSDQIGQVKGKTELHLTVSDANQRVLCSESNKASDQIQAGNIYNHNLIIGGANCAPPPSENQQAGDLPVK